MADNPHDIGVHNGNIFGFDVEEQNAEIVIIPVPWDVTASYAKGTSKGPESILKASVQLDFYHPFLENAWDAKIYMAPISEEWKAINDEWNGKLQPYFKALENGESTDEYGGLIAEANEIHNILNQNLLERCERILDQHKVPAVLGGEHSVPLSLIKSIGRRYESFGILQLDAHADLRTCYEGFDNSHASIMFNALKVPSMKKLVQVGIRDLSAFENRLATDNEKVVTFYDWDIKNDQLERNKSWLKTCENIVDELPDNVYISFDIDALDPLLCPNTGTPVPGGFRFEEVRFLLQLLVRKKKRIIGFDLCEVAPGENDWDANVGARILWELCVCTLHK